MDTITEVIKVDNDLLHILLSMFNYQLKYVNIIKLNCMVLIILQTVTAGCIVYRYIIILKIIVITNYLHFENYNKNNKNIIKVWLDVYVTKTHRYKYCGRWIFNIGLLIQLVDRKKIRRSFNSSIKLIVRLFGRNFVNIFIVVI